MPSPASRGAVEFIRCGFVRATPGIQVIDSVRSRPDRHGRSTLQDVADGLRTVDNATDRPMFPSERRRHGGIIDVLVRPSTREALL